jgi:MinD-like ATPase involved in chromosome partitioning or flagellar assembly
VTVIGFCSAKHSPGVTTSALALLTALGPEGLLIEADPAGGDLAPTLQLSTEVGLLSAHAAMRNGNRASLTDHLQLHQGRQLLIGPTDPNQMTNVLSRTGIALVELASEIADTVLVDLGRLPHQGVHPLVNHVDQMVVVLRPTLNAVDHLRNRLGDLPDSTQILVVGSTPYKPVEVAEALNRSLNGVLPMSQRDVELLIDRPSSKAYDRSALAKSSAIAAQTLVNTLSSNTQADRLVS